MIDRRYLEIITQCERRIDELNEFEKGFILGNENGKYKNGPIRERSFLTAGQKEVLDKIVVQRFEGGKWNKNKVRKDFGDVSADRTDEGYIITVNGKQVGFGIGKKEVPIVACWLDGALRDILQLPTEAFGSYLVQETQGKETTDEELEQVINGTPPEVVEDEEDPF